MGWTFYRKPPGVSATDSLRDHFGRDWWDQKVIATAANWAAVFVVVEHHDPESDVYVPDADGKVRALLVIKIRQTPRARDGYNFGYKDMSESSGPVGCEAPLSLLAKCSDLRPITDPAAETPLNWATNYRARCAQMATIKANKRKLQPGNVVTLAEPLSFGGQKLQTFVVDRVKLRGRKAKLSTVFRAPNGMLCAIRPADLVGATIT